jgi:ABC-2 type transport system ATP-binding protein
LPVRGPAIEARGLGKSFGARVAVAGIDLEVKAGELFAFLGPNGAGKTTTVQMLCTLLMPTTGSARVAGHDCARQDGLVRKRIGLVFQERSLDPELTVLENLRFHAGLYGVPKRDADLRIEALLDRMGLADRAQDAVSGLSGGLARRLELARALLHRPDVLFLDEPTLGLDPAARARFWDDVGALRKEHGFTVFFTTHYLDEAEVADRVAILHQGRIVAMGAPDALRSQAGVDEVRVQVKDAEGALAQVQAAGLQGKLVEGGIVVAVRDGHSAVARIVRAIQAPIEGIHVRRPTLDDVFLHFTGESLEEP